MLPVVWGSMTTVHCTPIVFGVVAVVDVDCLLHRKCCRLVARALFLNVVKKD